jgi:hypothetical protein
MWQKKKKGYADSKTHLNRSIDINKYTNRIGVAVLPPFFFFLFGAYFFLIKHFCDLILHD